MTPEESPTLKWQRSDGGYLAEIPNVGTVRIFKMYDGWKIHLVDGYYVNRQVRLLADAKRLAASPEWLPLLITGREQRLLKEREKKHAETVKRVADKIRTCRLADSHLSPPAGVPWYEWAERKVGCTAADVRAASREAEVFAVLDKLRDKCLDKSEDFDEWISKWRGE